MKFLNIFVKMLGTYLKTNARKTWKSILEISQKFHKHL